MPDFIIKISTPADLSGAQATIQSFAQVEQTANAVNAAATRAGSADLRPLAQGAQEAGKQLSEAEHEADHLLESLKLGVGIDIGHRIVESIAEVPAAFREAIQEGVAYNASVETLTIQLAGALRSANPAQYLNFSEARAAGAEALEQLRQKANELGTDFHALAETFAVNVPVLAKAGIKEVGDQIQAIVLLNQVAASKGIGGFQAQRDIIDILNGQGNRTLLGKELETQGVSNESIKQAEQMGTLMDLLRDKLGAYGEAGTAAASTFTAAQQRLRNETEQLYGDISKPVFAELKDAYDSLAVEIDKPEVREALRGLGYDIASLVDAGASLARFAIENAGVLVPLATAIGLVSFALAAYKAAQIASIIGARLTTLVAETEATTAQTIAVTAETEALEANTLAKAANAEAGVGAAVAGEGAAVGTGLGAAVGGAGAATIGGVALAGLVPGALIFGARQHAADQEGEQDQEIGETSQANSQRLDDLRNAVARAKTDEEQTKARKKLTDELIASKKQLDQLEQADADRKDNDEGGAVYDYEANAKIADLKVYVQLLEHANAESAKLAGTNPLAGNREAFNDNAHLAAYQQSPEARLAAAQASGNQQGIDDATYDAQVDAKRSHLEKTYGLNPDQAEQQAQTEVSAADQRKEKEDDDAKAERDKKKADREAKLAQDKATRAAQQAAADRKQHDDTLKAEDAELAVLNAKASGNKTLADQLERQLEIQREIQRLMSAGVSYDDASWRATQVINLRDDQRQDRSSDGGGGGGRGSRGGGKYLPLQPIQGYTDPQSDQGTDDLHSSGLTSTPLTSGGLGPHNSAASSSAGAALGNPGAAGFGDPVAALGNPAASGFGDAGGALADPAASGFADPAAALNNPAAYGFTPTTAAAAVAPALGGSAGAGLGAGGGAAAAGGGDGGASSALNGTAQGANQATKALSSTADLQKSAQSLTSALGTFAQGLGGLQTLPSTLSDLQSQIDQINGVLSTLTT